MASAKASQAAVPLDRPAHLFCQSRVGPFGCIHSRSTTSAAPTREQRIARRSGRAISEATAPPIPKISPYHSPPDLTPARRPITAGILSTSLPAGSTAGLKARRSLRRTRTRASKTLAGDLLAHPAAGSASGPSSGGAEGGTREEINKAFRHAGEIAGGRDVVPHTLRHTPVTWRPAGRAVYAWRWHGRQLASCP